MSVEQREEEQARAQEKRRNFSEGQGKKEGGRSREKRQRSSEEQREKETTAFQNHHGRHFANGVMADGFSTVFGHLFPGSVSLYKANL